IPNPVNKVEIELFVATFAHVRPCAVAVKHSSPGQAPQAKQAWHVEKNYRVAARDSLRQRAAKIAVNYPGIATRQLVNRLQPLFVRRLGPACTPVKSIKMFDFNAKYLAQPSCKRRLA